jgi:hypothetical protein
MVNLNKVVCRSINSFCVLSKIFPDRLSNNGIYGDYIFPSEWNNFVVLQSELNIVKFKFKLYNWTDVRTKR